MKDPRASFLKALKKLNSGSADVVACRVDELIRQLAESGFAIPHNPSDGIDQFWGRLHFERPHSEKAFEFINIVFSDKGDLRFSAQFGVREYENPDIWHCNGWLSKRRLGIWKTSNLGSTSFRSSHADIFVNDWIFLLSKIDDIVSFLETGRPRVNLSDVEVFDRFRPKSEVL